MNEITIEEALQTLSRRAGGEYVALDRHLSMCDGRVTTSWYAWRGDVHKGCESDTMETALADALKFKRDDE